MRNYIAREEYNWGRIQLGKNIVEEEYSWEII